MELKDFVKNTILDIVNGVKEAQEANDSDSIIIPQFGASMHGKHETIHFDVAVEANTQNAEGGKVGIAVAGFLSGGVRGETTNAESRVSRVQFDMQIQFFSGEFVHRNK